MRRARRHDRREELQQVDGKDTMANASAKKTPGRKQAGTKKKVAGANRAGARQAAASTSRTAQTAGDVREELPIDDADLARELAPMEISLDDVRRFHGPLIALRAFVDDEFVTLGVVDAARLPKCRYCGNRISFDRVVMANSRGWEALYDSTRCRRLAASYRNRHDMAVPRATTGTKKTAKK